ncbi:hypothetical protein GCM10010440_26420 [Kitasatospora cinereorecta]
MPSVTRAACAARLSPEGRGVAAVAAIAASVMVTFRVAGSNGCTAMAAPRGYSPSEFAANLGGGRGG